MLQREEPVVDELGDLHPGGVDTEDPARVFHLSHCDIAAVSSVAFAHPGVLRSPAEVTGSTPVSLGRVIDLHLHSTCSDGSERPEHVVELAARAGCRAIALTDHDGLAGCAAARRRAGELGIVFVDGCEVSCTDAVGTIHLLVYFVDERSGFDAFLSRLREDRARRNGDLLERLGAIGMPIEEAELTAAASGGLVGRPHFAAVLVARGWASSVTDAFDRFLGDGGPAFVPRDPVLPASVIAAATASGGVVAFAHPKSTGLDHRELERYVGTLSDLGLVGLEATYGRYDAATRGSLHRLARQFGLVPTGGSDFHGSSKPDLRVGVGRGDLRVPDDVLDELVARRAALGPTPPDGEGALRAGD